MNPNVRILFLKLLTNIDPWEGMTNPKQELDTFNELMSTNPDLDLDLALDYNPMKSRQPSGPRFRLKRSTSASYRVYHANFDL